MPEKFSKRIKIAIPAKGLLRYGTKLFSVLFSSKNIPYRNFVPRKNTVRNSTVRKYRTQQYGTEIFPYRITVPIRTIFFNQFTSRKIQQETFSIAFFKIFSCIFILQSRESDQCAVQAPLRVASHLSTTPRWGNPAKCLFKRYNQ